MLCMGEGCNEIWSAAELVTIKDQTETEHCARVTEYYSTCVTRLFSQYIGIQNAVAYVPTGPAAHVSVQQTLVQHLFSSCQTKMWN